MKPAIIPIFCSLVLVSLATAGASHWWSVHQLMAASGEGPAQAPLAVPSAPPTPAKAEVSTTVTVNPPPPVHPEPQQPAPDLAIQKMLEQNSRTLDEVKRLTKENRDLRDQMAETNRDLMKLEFRVDTHSESFRPLPSTDNRPDTTLDVNRVDSNGVLPVLDEPLPLPTR